MKTKTLSVLAVIILIAALSVFVMAPAQVVRKLNRVIANFGESVNLGVLVEDADTGKIIYEKNASRYFLPASNQKLFTAWTALNTLDSNFIYQTQLFVDTKKIKNGILNDSIYIKFSGDPTLTFSKVEHLMSALSRAGVKRITGNIVIDDSVFDQDPMSPGTTWDDKDFCYGAPVNALTVDHNCVHAILIPATKPTEPTQLMLPEQPQFMRFVNDATTDFAPNSNCRIAISLTDKTSYTITGCIKSSEAPSKIAMAVSDPRANVKAILNYLLHKNNINYIDHFQFQKIEFSADPLASESSVPLAGLLTVMLKESDNTIADALFKTIGERKASHPGGWKNGSEAMHDVLLKTLQLDIPANTIIDGAGGSRYIYHTPEQIITLLRKVYASSYAQVFIPALAVSGVDGTLKERFQASEARAKIFAKTGTMSGVTALSGYLETRKKHKLIFSIMINGFIESPDKYKILEDSLCMALINFA
jgi:D-alanyl-D-alanine carboxypeptidase/D-alanyl-D-alanine-endopeptidase (penicillin-binding protein 4)